MLNSAVGILTFISRKNSILGLSEPEKAECLDIFSSPVQSTGRVIVVTPVLVSASNSGCFLVKVF